MQITIKRGTDYVKEFSLKKGPNQITLWSGEYQIELSMKSDSIRVDKDIVVIGRGDAETVRIYHVETDRAPTELASEVEIGQQPPLAVAPFGTEQAHLHQSLWADHLGLPATRESSIGIKLALIPPGEFKMGSPESEDDRDEENEGLLHRVRITQPFYLGVYEVSQQEYRQITGSNPSSFSATGTSANLVAGRDTDRHPVEKVSWVDATHFCVKLSALPDEKRSGGYYRLPTEAEWEYACRAGTATAFHYGDSLSGEQANFDGSEPYRTPDKQPSLGSTQPVGSYQPNAFGLFDMHGNVWEWCGDVYKTKYYPRSIINDPPGPRTGTHLVSRGGSWRYSGSRCRSAGRGHDPHDYTSWSVGIRVVWLPPPRNFNSPSSIEREEISNSIGMKLVAIPAGEFVMGSPEAERQVTLGRTVQVGSYAMNKYGLYDMHGNVREWCADWYDKDYYAHSPSEDPQGPASGTSRVGKGGSWATSARWARSANHSTWAPTTRSASHGMRLVCESPDAANEEPLATMVNSIGTALKLIPAGEFQMGAPESEDGRQGDEDQHQVKITKPFYIGVYEVTQAEYRQVAGVNPSYFATSGGGVQEMETDRFPVEMISWPNAVKYCEQLSALPEEKKAGRRYRLPTEAEWEYACRAGTTSSYNHGNSDSTDRANYQGEYNEGPRHRVRITKPFHMGMYEVTQQQYRRVMNVNPSAFAAGGKNEAKVEGLETSHFPVEMVSWSDALEFCAKLSLLPEELRARRRYRLPTEAEWEYACRAGTTTPFHFGIAISPRQANVGGSFSSPYGYAEKANSLGRTCEVGSYTPNPFGLYDMHGNVYELCADWYDYSYYANSPGVDPLGPSTGSSRNRRGGGWSSSSYSRAANREGTSENRESTDHGFRVVCD